MSASSQDLLRGTLDSLILKTLSLGPRHGYGVARWLEQTTSEALAIEEGSLYPALYRLQKRGFITAEWGTSELGRSAKFYRMTERGKGQLVEQMEKWNRFAAAVSQVLMAEA